MPIVLCPENSSTTVPMTSWSVTSWVIFRLALMARTSSSRYSTKDTSSGRLSWRSTISLHRVPHLLCWRALEVQGVRLRARRLASAAPCEGFQFGEFQPLCYAEPCDQLRSTCPLPAGEWCSTQPAWPQLSPTGSSATRRSSSWEDQAVAENENSSITART